MAMTDLHALKSVTLRTGIGAYDTGEEIHRIAVARSLGGVTELEVASDGSVEESVLGKLQKVVRASLALLLNGLAPVLSRFSLTPPKPFEDSGSPKNLVIGIRASAVNFSSELVQERDSFAHAGAEQSDKSGKGRRRTGPVVDDTLTVSLGKAQFQLLAKVRVEQLSHARRELALDADAENRFEPAPWAAWRASLHHTPLKPAKGIHLRYLLGDGEGLAVLGSGRWPLAWQVLSWTDETKSETLLQALYILRLHATRRLQLGGIDHVSVQGNNHLDGGWEAIEQATGTTVQHVDGPAYDKQLIAFGLALGALDPKTESIDLASSMREAPPLLKLVPWGEVGLGMALFLCMFLVMSNHAAGMRKDLFETNTRIGKNAWAKNTPIGQLKNEATALEREVTPLVKFIGREISFSHALASVADVLPGKTWLVVSEAKDLMWEKNPNKALGEHYLLLDTGVPNTSGDTTPSEINETVRKLENHKYLQAVLPRAKLTDVSWQQEGGSGYTRFSVLLLPKK